MLRAFNIAAVDLTLGAALKLPYNNNDDPFVVAQRFIDEHQLPQDHLEQVAQFIITNSNSAPVASNTGYFDPFTGGNRSGFGSAYLRRLYRCPLQPDH